MPCADIRLAHGLLWLMEEAYLLAPSVFPKHVHWLRPSSARLHFGGSIRPTDKPAVHALLRTWVGLCIMLGTVFSATSVIIFACDDKTWHEPDATAF